MTKEGDKKECRILHYVKPNNLIKIFGPTEKWQLADLTLKRLRRGEGVGVNLTSPVVFSKIYLLMRE